MLDVYSDLEYHHYDAMRHKLIDRKRKLPLVRLAA